MNTSPSDLREVDHQGLALGRPTFRQMCRGRNRVRSGRFKERGSPPQRRNCMNIGSVFRGTPVTRAVTSLIAFVSVVALARGNATEPLIGMVPQGIWFRPWTLITAGLYESSPFVQIARFALLRLKVLIQVVAPFKWRLFRIDCKIFGASVGKQAIRHVFGHCQCVRLPLYVHHAHGRRLHFSWFVRCFECIPAKLLLSTTTQLLTSQDGNVRQMASFRQLHHS